MGKAILMEEFHVTVYARRGLPSAEYQSMQRSLARRRFQARLSQAVRSVFGQYRTLRNVRVKLSR